MKIICADTVSVGLSYDTNFKWHMPISGEICHSEQNYMSFLGPPPSAFSGNGPKHRNAVLWIFFTDKGYVFMSEFAFEIPLYNVRVLVHVWIRDTCVYTSVSAQLRTKQILSCYENNLMDHNCSSNNLIFECSKQKALCQKVVSHGETIEMKFLIDLNFEWVLF